MPVSRALKPAAPGRQIHDATWLAATLTRMTAFVKSQTPVGESPALVGIQTGGAVLATRLAQALSRPGAPVPVGTLDITYYRDDATAERRHKAKVSLPFEVKDRWIFLVDDVLYKGRTARAAIEALVDLGRPRAIRFLVLVDREGREFPIQADYAGERVVLPPGEKVEITLKETHGEDAVRILPA